MKNILFVSIPFDFSCGISRNVFDLVSNLSGNKDYSLHLMTNGGNALGKLKDLQINYKRLTYKTGIFSVLFLIPNLIYLFYYIKKNRIDVLHTHHRYPELLGFILSKVLKIRTVATVHSLFNNKKSLSFRSDKIIAVSQAVKKMLIEQYNVDEEKVFQIYNFVDTKTIQVQGKSLKKSGKISNNDAVNLCYLGRLDKAKGVDVLISAFDELSVKYNIKLLIAGKSNDKSIKNQILSTKGITFFGEIEDISGLLKQSDIVVLPSRSESLSYIMLEAGMSKLAFVGPNFGGVPEFISEGFSGLLFTPGDSVDLSKKIEILIVDKNMRLELGENLYNEIIKKCDKENYFKVLKQLYER